MRSDMFMVHHMDLVLMIDNLTDEEFKYLDAPQHQ